MSHEAEIARTLHALFETARTQHLLLEELFADNARAAAERASLAQSMWEAFTTAHARLAALLLSPPPVDE